MTEDHFVFQNFKSFRRVIKRHGIIHLEDSSYANYTPKCSSQRPVMSQQTVYYGLRTPETLNAEPKRQEATVTTGPGQHACALDEAPSSSTPGIHSRHSSGSLVLGERNHGESGTYNACSVLSRTHRKQYPTSEACVWQVPMPSSVLRDARSCVQHMARREPTCLPSLRVHRP